MSKLSRINYKIPKSCIDMFSVRYIISYKIFTLAHYKQNDLCKVKMTEVSVLFSLDFNAGYNFPPFSYSETSSFLAISLL